MQESDTYLAILDEGKEKALREAIFLFNEERLVRSPGLIGSPRESTNSFARDSWPSPSASSPWHAWQPDAKYALRPWSMLSGEEGMGGRLIEIGLGFSF